MAPMTARHAVTLTPEWMSAATVQTSHGTYAADDESYCPMPRYSRGLSD